MAGTIIRYISFAISLYFAGLLGIELLEVVKKESLKNITKGFSSTSALSRGLNP
jgi:hypothetical protein